MHRWTNHFQVCSHFGPVLGVMYRSALMAAIALVCAAQPSRGVSYGQAKAVAIYAPAPEYPIEARQSDLTGDGVIVIDIDHNTGYVTAARITKSTGHKILDNAALRAVRLWRFKLGSFKPQVRIPFEFTSSSLGDSIPQPRKGDLIYAPRPEYPYKSRAHLSQGRGTFILRVRPDGSVARVDVEDSTGAPLLDRAAIAAYSRWRFKPGRVTAVRIPTDFTMTGVRY